MKRRKIQKRPITLIELFLGVILSSALLFTLFFAYRHLALFQVKVEKNRNFLAWEWIFQTKFTQMLDQMQEEQSIDLKKDSLSFFFDNGLDPDPNLTGILLGTLHKKNGNFCLSLKRNKKDKTSCDLILHRTINSVHFSYFDPKLKRWTSKLWKLTTPPPIIRVQVDSQTFSFPLARAQNRVIIQ